jgi:translocation and assembly module TamB
MQLRRTAVWTLRVLAVLTLAGVVGGYLLLKSRIFREYAVRVAVQTLTNVTGGRAEVGNLEIQLSALTVSLYDLTLHGRENSSQPPLLHVDRVSVRPKIHTFLYRQITLDTVLVDHPVVHTVVDTEGRNNIPQASPGAANQRSGFALNISHLLVSKGEIYHEDKKTALDADVYDLGLEIQVEPQAKNYKSWISYHNGLLRCLNCTPIRHSLTAKFDATPSHLSIESARATAGSSTLFIRGEVDNLSSPTIDADYDIEIHTEDFAAKSWSVAPLGDVSLSGKVHYKSAGNQPFLRNLSIDGQLSSAALTARSGVGLLKVRKFYGRYQLANGTLRARSVSAELLGGQATIDVYIHHLHTRPVYQVSAALRGISLQEAQQAVRGADFKRVALYGTVDGTADAFWTGGLGKVISHCALRVHASAASTKRGSEIAVPVEGTIDVSYDEGRDVLRFKPTILRVPSMTLSIQGEASAQSNLRIDADAADLAQTAALASAIRFGKANVAKISGSAVLRAMMQGEMRKPRFVGQVIARDLVIHDSRWRSATIAAQLTPSAFAIRNSCLVSAYQGKACFSGSVELHNWSYLPSNSMSVSLSMQRMRLADLQGLAKQNFPASGDLSADIDLHGSELDPTGSGTVKILNARLYDEPLQTLMLELRANHGSIHATVNIGLHAGLATVNFSYAPPTKAYNLSLSIPSIVLQELHAVRVRNLPLRGVVKASATGQGTLDNPRLTAVIDLPEAQFLQSPISHVRGEVHIANQRADLALSSQLANASVQVHGHLNLTGDYYGEATIDTGTLQFDRFLETYLPKLGEGFRANTELHGTVQGPLWRDAQLEAHLTIPMLNASYESFEIKAADPIRVDYANSVVTLQPVEFLGPGTSLRVQASMPLRGTSALNLSAKGSVDAGLLRMVVPEAKSSGAFSFDIRATGSVKNPSVRGQLQLNEFAFSTASAPLGLENVNGSLEIADNRLRISTLSGQFGGGRLSMAGSILYWPNLQFDVTLETNTVRLRHPSGLRMLLDAKLAFTGTSNSSTLKGRVLIDSLSFSPDFELAGLSEQLGSNRIDRRSGFADSVKLAVAVQSMSRLSATSSVASVEGNVNLQLVGTAANPVIVGRTNLTSGEFFYRSRRYQLQRGSVVFNDPNKTRPALDVSVTTTVQQYNLTVTLRGPTDKLTTSYVSDPPLATADIISLIAIGNTSQTTDAAAHGTDPILASQVGSQFSTKMQNLTGISGLRIDPLIGGSYRNPSARIAIQQRVTKNFLFTFSTDVSQTGGETVEGKYQINKRWSVGATRDPVGGVSVDGTYHTRF